MKKRPTFQLHIPEPCSQDFSQMHPLPGGRYCSQCERTIMDFRHLSDGEIARIYQQRQGRVCGVFRADQFGRELTLPTPPERNRNWAAVAAVSASLFLANEAAGQSVDIGVVTQVEQVEAIPAEAKKPTEKSFVEGTVTDAASGEPLIFANITTDKGWGIGSSTDEAGKFRFGLPKSIDSLTIHFSYIGYETLKYQWIKNTAMPLTISLKPDTIRLKECVVVGVSARRSHTSITGLIAVPAKKEAMPQPAPAISEKPKLPLPDISISPNPFVSNFALQMASPAPGAYLFHLYTEAGQLVFAETRELLEGEQTLHFDLALQNLPDGIYFLRTSDVTGEVRTKKLVKTNP